MSKTSAKQNELSTMRLDKWLWCARFFKTRQLAVSAIKSGKVKIGGNKAKPARTVSAGDNLVIDKKGVIFEISISALSAQRLSAPLAAHLYLETEQSIEKRKLHDEIRKLDRLSQIKAPKHRPDSRNRRDRAKFKRGE